MNDTGKSAKLAKYDRLYEQIKGYIHTTEDIWARLATMEAVLHHKMQTFFWTGVCWAAVSSEKTVIVGNVEDFPGHIACNSMSKSEIVIPIRDPEGKVFACLDIDSDKLDAFDQEDEEGLKKILSLLYE